LALNSANDIPDTIQLLDLGRVVVAERVGVGARMWMDVLVSLRLSGCYVFFAFSYFLLTLAGAWHEYHLWFGSARFGLVYACHVSDTQRY
jgi:hypothetical protein